MPHAIGVSASLDELLKRVAKEGESAVLLKLSLSD